MSQEPQKEENCVEEPSDKMGSRSEGPILKDKVDELRLKTVVVS